MISTIKKFKIGVKNYSYQVDFEQHDEKTLKGEYLTLRSNNSPRPALLSNAQRVVNLAIQYCGLQGLITEQNNLSARVGIGLASITWSDGDEPGSRLEVYVTSIYKRKNSAESCESKITLPKINDREEMENIGKGEDRISQPVPGSLKNAYNEAVKLLIDQVKAFAEGEVEQGDLFRTSELVAARS
jgi:hypothetical protein